MHFTYSYYELINGYLFIITIIDTIKFIINESNLEMKCINQINESSRINNNLINLISLNDFINFATSSSMKLMKLMPLI